jgi:2-polyprenyl-6-methoxyphenol hydroxylase-like FAD-dependent oxidoreductase
MHSPSVPVHPAAVDVCIQGAGPVGACLALGLAHEGWSVALVDPGRRTGTGAATASAARPAAPDLRAYALNAASVALLQRLRIWDALPAGAATPVARMAIHGDGGGQLEFTAWQQTVTALAWIVDAGALDATLAQALAWAPKLQRVAAPMPAALKAICEGRASASRAELGVRFDAQAYGHRGIAAWVQADQPHDGCAWQWFRQPDVLALLPFDRAAAGDDAPGPLRRAPALGGYGLVWSVPDRRADELLALTDAEFEAELMAASGGAAGALGLVSPRVAWPLQYARASAVSGPGWVLVGDAAHAVHPLSGHGLNLGLGDVEGLVRVLGQAHAESPWRDAGDARTLRRYARERAMPVWLMGSTTDALWQLFDREVPLLRELRNKGMDVVNQLTPLKRWLAGQALG